MRYSLEIRLDHVICRDPESLNGRDNFALLGGVIVDGAWVPFVRDPISITPTMGREEWPEPTIFKGHMTDREIGLVLRAYDIDNNSAWKRDREKIKETMAALAMGVGFVPIIGDVAAKILKAWPIVVDGIVALDGNDLLLNHSQAVKLPDVAFTNPTATRHDVEVRFRSTDPTGYSDWDYSLYLALIYRNEYTPSFGGRRAEHTRHARRDSKAQEWVGAWVSDRIRCEIARSARGGDLLDVRVTESGGSARKQVEQLAVPITRPVDSRILEQGPRLSGGVAGRGVNPVLQGGPGIRGKPMKAVGRPGAVGRVADPNLVVKVPQREHTGADRLMLPNDAALEIYALRDRGQPTPLRILRYVRPYTKPSAVAALQIDEYLQFSSLG
ncbi:MAG TPA: hypothetical protein VK929_05455 [Longimicrobiales bacterium]|nr:hypothetical protein [Longimicrobiales bacterium]